MEYKIPEIAKVAKQLKGRFESLKDKRAILRDPGLMALFDRIKELEPKKRAAFGKEVNHLKQELEQVLPKDYPKEK